MSKLLLAVLFSAFAMTSYGADTDNQTNGAELGTEETPQAQEQNANTKAKATTTKSKKTKRHMHKKAKTNAKSVDGSENNPLQPTEPEPAPGAAH